MTFPALSRLLSLALATFILNGRVVTASEPDHVDWEIPADTNQVKSWTPDQAKMLVSRHTKRTLQLNGLTELTPPVAVHLKKFGGDRLELNGVAHLSAVVASHLNEFRGSRIDMNGLHALSPHAADEIAWFEGHLSFDGLATLSPETASNLVAYRERDVGGWIAIPLKPGGNDERDAPLQAEFSSRCDNMRRELSLNGLTELSPEVAQHLATYGRNRLTLDGLQAISPEAAKALAAFKGKELSLCGLTTLPHDVARALSERKGLLLLDGVTTLSNEAAMAIKNHKGPLGLAGLKSLSDEAARNLRENPAIVLPVSFASEDTQPHQKRVDEKKAEPGVGADSR